MARWRAQGIVKPVPEDEEIAMFNATRDTLVDAGLAAYEVSNFAQAGHTSVHNQLYWRGEYYLGVGAGAHSFTPSQAGPVRREGKRLPSAYVEAWTKKCTSTFEFEEVVSNEALADEHVLTGLRTVRGWHAARTEEMTGLAACATAERVAARQPEWCSFDGEFLRPTAAGLLMNDALILCCAMTLAEKRREHVRTSGASVIDDRHPLIGREQEAK
jgi:oxygen-independent coproporphyrinogen-3 oxidase